VGRAKPSETGRGSVAAPKPAGAPPWPPLCLGGIARATPKAWSYVATQGRDRSRLHVVRVLVLACTEVPAKQSQKNRCPSMALFHHGACPTNSWF
jgi:hypothetical protein